MSDFAQRLAALSPEKRQLLELIRQDREKPPGGAFSLIGEEDRGKLPDGLEDAYPLVMLQLGMIYHMEITLDHPVPAYHNVNSFHVEARFDHGALQRAVDEVVCRHATLRTTFHLEGFSEPLQLVHRAVSVPIEALDLRSLAREEQERCLEAFFASENRRVFELSNPPLLRIHVHRRTDRRFQFTLTEPHVISEGWSTTSTLAEISDHYLALIEGRPFVAPPSPAVPYREFVRLEREALSSPEARAFWQARLASLTVARLPRWPQGFRGAERAANRKPRYDVPAGLLAGLAHLARTAALPIKSVLLAAHLKVLSLWSGEAAVVTGLEFHGRPEERGGDEVRGVFINTLPVQLDLGGSSWVELARRAFEAETEILPHRRYPLAALQKGREAPLFEVSFTYLQFHGIDRVFSTDRMTLYRAGISDLSVSSFPLAATFHRAEGGVEDLCLVLEYDDLEFSLPQIRWLQRTYEQVLQAMVRAPHARHDAGLPLSPADHQQVLVEWNAAPEPACGEALIHRWIAARAAERPTAPAVEHQARSLSYAELERLAGALARRLRELGAGPDVLVGLCVERSCDMIVGILGILQAGAAYLPLDPGYPPQRVAFLLQDAGSGIVVTEGRLAERFAAPSIRLVLLDALPDTGTPAEPLLDTGVTPDNLAYVIYTSGSTGRPKGVQVTHRTLVASTAARLAYYREPVERFLLLSSSAFDSSVAGIFGTLCQGGTLLLPPQEAERDPQLIVAQVATRHASHLLALPSLYSLVLEEEGKPLGSLRAVIVAGEACPADLVARHVSALRETALYNEYGPTEATVWCSVHDAASPQRSERVPIGRTIPGARLYVLDPFGSPSPVGAPGELWVGGCGVARGYLHRPELTAERFLPDPYSADPGARQYRTGDVARWLPDGTLEFLGRRDHQVKVRGFRIELEEVEATLGQHPGVREAVVLARRDGGAEPRLAAYVVAGEPAPTGGALRTFLRQRLPEYMVPAYFLFLASLPLNPNGKLDRAALPAPGSDRPELDRDYAPPRDEVERTLAAVWQEQLGLEKVGIHDNFFELGGSSLLMIQTHRRQRAVLGVELTLADMFQSPTIADLAARIQQAGSTGPSLQASQERATARKTSADQISRARELRLNAKRR